MIKQRNKVSFFAALVALALISGGASATVTDKCAANKGGGASGENGEKGNTTGGGCKGGGAGESGSEDNLPVLVCPSGWSQKGAATAKKISCTLTKALTCPTGTQFYSQGNEIGCK